MSDAFGPVRWALNVPPMLRKDGTPDGTAHHVLLVLATFAKRDGSDARPSTVTLADKAYKTERAVIDALARIESAGLISKQADFNGTTVWRLHLELARIGPTVLDERRERAREKAAERQRRRRQRMAEMVSGHASPERDVTPSDSVTVTASRSVTHAVRERESRPAGACVTPPPPLQPQVSTPVTTNELPLNYQKNSSAPPAPDPDSLFEEFWKPYPRKKEKKDARKAWDKALKDGANPQDVIAGSKRYAAENAGQDPKFIKHPATWLNKGCWEDEPEQRHLRAVSGDGYRPWQNPADQSVYDEDL